MITRRQISTIPQAERGVRARSAIRFEQSPGGGTPGENATLAFYFVSEPDPSWCGALIRRRHLLVEDHTPLARYVESKRYTRFQGVARIVTLGGGVGMLLVAALAHDSASIPLLILGTAWTAIAIAGVTTTRRTFRAVRFDDGVVTFVSPGRSLSIPVAEIIEVRHARGDVNRVAPLKVITSSNGALRISPRLNGLIELLLELKTANPALRVDHL
jgi:hypothetical protein